MRIVLISCVKQKRPYKCKAKDMYISPLFKGAYKYAKSFNPDRVYILSAKYGLLHIDDIIQPYDETLKTKSASQIKEWSEKVLLQMQNEGISFTEDKFIILASEKYRRELIKSFSYYIIPNDGLGIGKQLKKYSTLTKQQQLCITFPKD